MRSVLSFAAALLLLGACYNYVPVGTLSPSSDARVRVSLTDMGTVQMASQVGPGIGSIEGRVLAADSDTVRLGVIQATTRTGITNLWSGETVAVPRSSAASIEQRRLSKRKTLLFAGTTVVGMVAAVVAGASGVLGGDGPPKPPPPPSGK